ncbi:RNA polymerase II elongation factor [Rhizophlyctis rosea]|nr:RNA polymerase II elongation factor [Rhizophlyctis rosea]
MSLTDEDVLKIVQKLRKSLDEEEHSRTEDLLTQLQKFVPTTDRLKKTKVGVFVNEIKKNEKANEKEKSLARELVNKWKKEVGKTSAPESAPTNGEKNGTPRRMLRKSSDAPQTPQTPKPRTVNERTVKSDNVKANYPGQSVRDKCLELLYKALATDTSEDAQRVVSIAEKAERHTFAKFGTDGEPGEPYKARIRSMIFNVQNKTNPEFRDSILRGEIDPQRFAVMPVEEMASKDRQDEIAAKKKEAADSAVVAKPVQSVTDMFSCGKCHKRQCTYYQMQTRSADEPMTTFVTCTYCGNKWKVPRPLRKHFGMETEFLFNGASLHGEAFCELTIHRKA